jgi:hypothetical protein
MGTMVFTFAYFEDGHWIAPEAINEPERGTSVIDPLYWIAMPVPIRH